MTFPALPASGDDCSTPAHATLCDALDEAAASDTGLHFYSGRGELPQSLGYGELRAQALRLAGRLLAAGLRRGDRVALVAETDADFVRSFFGCLYAGLVPAPLPLPAALGAKEHYLQHLRRMIESADAAAALGPVWLESWLRDAGAGLGLRIVGTAAMLEDYPISAASLPRPQPDDLAYLQFSSGSTRFPLGIAVTHRAVCANVAAIAQHGLRIGREDRCVSWLPFYHDMGLVGFLLTPVFCAIPVDLLPTREFARRPLTWLQLLSRHGGTLSYSPSFGYELCVRRAAAGVPAGLDLSRWRAAGIGGDMVRPGPLAAFAQAFAACGFRDRAFVPSYGMAEAALALSFAPLQQGLQLDTVDSDVLERQRRAEAPGPTSTRRRSFAYCGPILPGHLLQVRDERGRVLGERQVGRLYVKGPSLMQAYFRQPAETARVLADDWLDTGDLGYLAGGQIVITGRAKDLILVNGRNLWPQDLEWTAEAEVAALRSGDVAAFSVDRDGGEEVVVLVECRARDAAARAALCEEVAGVLRARHGVEARVVPVPPRTLPQTSSGKLSRAGARQVYLQHFCAESRVAASA